MRRRRTLGPGKRPRDAPDFPCGDSSKSIPLQFGDFSVSHQSMFGSVTEFQMNRIELAVNRYQDIVTEEIRSLPKSDRYWKFPKRELRA